MRGKTAVVQGVEYQALVGELQRARPNGATLLTFSGAPPAAMRPYAAELAMRLGMTMYRIDLGQVVSKYIGETEKNLSRLFARAEGKNWVLVFDEADSLFGKRSDVAEGQGTYTDRELGSLAQTLARFNGVIVLLSRQPVPVIESRARVRHVRVTFPPRRP